ncbi:MAG: hypothetical protein M1835_006009 [Candelina submexicana]|nr:MAG: hypothetical protein M1835_006009 [Candelina submexicana]
MSGPASGQSPRSSTSSRPSDRSSLTQSSGPSSPQSEDLVTGVGRTQRSSSRSNGQDSVNPRGDAFANGPAWGDFEGEQNNSFPSKGHRPRHSGGFLLDSAYPLGVRAWNPAHDPGNANLPAATTESRGHNLGITQSKERRQAHHRHRPKTSTSVGSSPLATKVTNAVNHDLEGQVGQRAADPDLISFAPSKTTHDVGEMYGGDAVDSANGKRFRNSDDIARGGFVSVGLDTDPAQIVNLALNLNESRRRNQFASRLPANGGNARRVTSAGQHSLGASIGGTNPSTDAGGRLRQHLQQQRRISRNISPISGKANRLSSASYNSAVQNESHAPLPATFSDSAGHQPNQEVEQHLSSSTLARAEKARTYIELSAEYKRLLALLPPLKARLGSSGKASSSEKSSPTDQIYPEPVSRVRSRSNDWDGLGRSYNPLQSIRNRRVRIRERATIDPELQGWHQTARVRTWIDHIEKRSAQPNFQAANNAQLPPWAGADQLESKNVSDPGAIDNHHNKPTVARRKKPWLYWSISPAELLADAYWVEQAEHKTLIEDKDNNKLYPRYTQIDVATGRRSYELPLSNRTDGPIVERKTEGHQKRGKEIEAAATSAHKDDTGRDRGRHRRQLQDTIRSHINRSSSRRKRAHLRIDTGRSRSTSRSTSSDGGSFRGRKKYSRRSRSHSDDISSSVLEKQMIDLLEQEAKDLAERDSNERSNLFGDDRPQASNSAKNVPGRTTESDGRSGLVHRSDSGRRNALFRKSIDHSPIAKRTSLSVDRGLRFGDSTNTANGVITVSPPSLSVPSSRDVSPKRKPFSLFTGDRSKAKHAISENDFAVNEGRKSHHKRQESPEWEDHAEFDGRKPRTWSPTKKTIPSQVEDTHAKDYRRSNNKGRRLAVGEKDGERVMRGMFRNGRIEELVRSEVSKVGDLMWRKDGANHGPNLSSSASSVATDSTDSDGYDSAGTDPANRSTERLDRDSGDDEDSEHSSKVPGSRTLHKYHIDNLPTFTSPFNRDEEYPKRASPEADHITRQQLARREQRRPSRFARLAPPKIDIRGVSPTSSPDLSRTTTHDDEGSYNDSRRGSYGAGRRADVVPFSAHQNVRSADMRLNAVLGLPGTVGRGGPPVTGLAGIASDRRRSTHRPSMNEMCEWSISGGLVQSLPAPGSKREMVRVQALLLSSGIKAKEISRRANEIRDPPLFLRKVCNPPFPLVPASQEHVVAAQMLSQNLMRISKQLQDMLSDSSANDLLDQIEAVKERIQANLTPLVRASADDADVFSTELTTTHTLAIKQLNDSVDILLRRRRRRLKWVRRAGYVLLEWILLGVMWWAWLIVVAVRLVRGTMMAVVGGVRWVLWL